MKKIFIFLFTFLLLNMALFSQEVSEKKDITIFKLSYSDWSIPGSALGSIDAEIKQVFVELGRFNVIGMTYRMDSDNVNAFVDDIKSLKEQSVEIPEEVNMGHMVFTEADYNRLVGSFIVVIPSVAYFGVSALYDDNGYVTGYKTEVKTEVSFLDVRTMTIIANPVIETSAVDKVEDSSVQDAIGGIAGILALKVKQIPAFTLKTGVLEVYNGGVTIELGSEMGIMRGYEFVIIRERVLKSGHKRQEEAGLLKVNDTSLDVSEATILYGDPVEGDQLKEVPRAGVELTPYIHALTSADNMTFTLGFRGTMAMGFYDFRPFVGVEIPAFGFGFSDTSVVTQTILNAIIGYPVNTYIGGEYTMYMGRFQIAPSVAIGLGGNVPRDDYSGEEYITHIGAMVNVGVSYLSSRDMLLTVDAGYAQWFSLLPLLLESYGGVMLGGGITIKL